jgi:hypothetical protein
VYWGDGSPHVVVTRGKFHDSHVYKRTGRFKIRVVAVDRAGNTTTVFRYVKIAPKTSSGGKAKSGGSAPKKV